jgi:DNA-binding HxlR family transcriptional regulator
MSQRSYGYYDPLAQALDAAGERWALLIVRELMSGAARYAEIAERLPGLSTARLADRLKEMHAAGLIEASDGYRLTEDGLALAPSVYALTRFGLRRLSPLAGTAVVYRASFGAFALRALADAAPWQAGPFWSLTVVEDHAFTTHAREHAVETRYADEHANVPAPIHVRLDTVAALALATGALTVRAALADGTLLSAAPARALRGWATIHNLSYQASRKRPHDRSRSAREQQHSGGGF